MAKKKLVECAKLQYRCRRCGVIHELSYEPVERLYISFHNSQYTDEQLDLTNKLLNRPIKTPQAFRHARLRLVENHGCQDGGIGVTDLIGWSPKKELPIIRGGIIQPEEEPDEG